MNKIVTKREYQAARYARQLLSPALNEIHKINRQACGNDDTVFGKIEEFEHFLTGVVKSHQAILDQGNAQQENRPIELINRAANRLFQIPSLIEVERKKLQHKLDARKYKADELVKQSFTQLEVDNIVPPVSQAEIDASNATIESLQAEAKAIEKYLADAPCYDASLLAGTLLYPVEDKAVMWLHYSGHIS